MADQAGLLGLFDFTGYAAGLGMPSGGRGSFGLSMRNLFYLQADQEQRVRMAEQMARRVEAVLKAGWKSEEWAVTRSRQEQWRQGWAATYTTLLAEV